MSRSQTRLLHRDVIRILAEGKVRSSIARACNLFAKSRTARGGAGVIGEFSRKLPLRRRSNHRRGRACRSPVVPQKRVYGPNGDFAPVARSKRRPIVEAALHKRQQAYFLGSPWRSTGPYPPCIACENAASKGKDLLQMRHGSSILSMRAEHGPTDLPYIPAGN
jgi:hypothetical protein